MKTPPQIFQRTLAFTLGTAMSLGTSVWTQRLGDSYSNDDIEIFNNQTRIDPDIEEIPPGTVKCKAGLLLPLWTPTTNLAIGDIIARGVVYFVLMVYMFVGVSIIADRFMAAIEVITSQEKQITIKKKGAKPQVISVRIWNETVSNLTLMALGSSAPEILLSIIEVIDDLKY